MGGARYKVELSKAKADAEGYSKHTATIRRGTQKWVVPVRVALVNSEIPYGVLEGSEEDFQATVRAFENMGKAKLRALIEEARK